ncbi:MAG: ATP-binding protein [Acidobacteriota bacterium]|nr:ATP-binding protein [Acidobacteriota bacterium]
MKRMRTSVDVLSMSATPIPRTLEMAVTGIREMSTITTPPEERHPVLTYVGAYEDRQIVAAVRRELLEAQAEAAGLPLHVVPLPWPCSNEQYETIMKAAVEGFVSAGFTHVAFGDLFLEDVRRDREERLAGSGLAPLFPLWKTKTTAALANDMLDGGLRATLTCVDPKQLDRSFAGRTFDQSLIDDLPAGVDPCGENGEFHSFAHTGPMFTHPIAVSVGDVVDRDGFVFADLSAQPATAYAERPRA